MSNNRFKKISMKAGFMSVALGFFVINTSGLATADNMKAFPPADAGIVRHVLQVPKQNDESAFKVEIIAGKTVLVDKENRYFFGGKIEKEVIKGW